jgi:hypothetical protein
VRETIVFERRDGHRLRRTPSAVSLADVRVSRSHVVSLV